MRKLKLLMAVCALVFGDDFTVNAYTTTDLTSAGWTQVTDLSTMTLSNYYFAIVSNDNTNLMIKLAPGFDGSATTTTDIQTDHGLWYMTGTDPLRDNSFLWTLEANSTSGYEGYTMRNVNRPVRVMQTHDGSPWYCRTNWETTPTRWSSYAFTAADGVYTIQALANGGTNYLGLWTPSNGYVSGQVLAGNKSGSEIGKFLLYSIPKTTADAKILAASDATATDPYDLAPALFGRYTGDYTGPSGYYGAARFCEKYLDSEAPSTGDKITKTITNAPNGYHTITVIANAAWISGRGSVGTSVPTTNDNSTVLTINGVSQNVPVRTDGNYNPVTLVYNNIKVTNNTINLALTNNDAAAFWFVLDVKSDVFVAPTIESEAIELPANGAMAADTWYYFDVNFAADNYLATATTLSDIICTTNGTQFISSATGDVTLAAENNSLSATRYYVKSSSANNLAISVAAYTYNISEGAADISYVQGGETVTVTFTTSTNEPNPSLTQNYSGVTFGGNAVTCTATASGFTFTVPTVTANTDYTLSIPAGAIKYNDDNKNAAQSITLHTPALFDGTYFLKAAATYDGSAEGTSNAVGKYMARGTAYGTHLSLDSYGLAVVVTTDNSNVTTLKMADTQAYVFSPTNSSFDCYADGAATEKIEFTVSVQNAKYLISNNYRSSGGTTKYLKYNDNAANNEEISVFDDGTGANAGPIILWTVETVGEHATAMQAKKDAQAASAATAAYDSGNYASLSGIATISALESVLTANYIQGDFVSASTISSVQESFQPRGNSYENSGPVTVYSNTIDITQAGFYKFSMQAFNRATGNDNVQALHTAGADMPDAVLFFGDSETQIKSIYDETGYNEATEHGGRADVAYNGVYYPDGTDGALVFFKADKYHNDVWFYCSTPGTYTYGVKVMGYANGQWFIYSPESVTITSYAAAATSEDYTALSNAITAYDNAVWGFESGEYAPYNNITAIENITAAKAINREGTNSKLLVNSLTTAIAVTANTKEENAIAYGDLSSYETVDGKDYPYGWSKLGDGSRIMGGSEGTNNGLAASSTGKVMVVKYNATYGETTGYNLPLKAGKIYKLTFKYCGWGNNPTTNVVLTDPENNTIALAPGFRPATSDGDSNAEHWYNYTGYFVSTTAGDYKLALNKVESGQQQIGWADMQLFSATEIPFADGSVPTYAPGTYPSVKISRTLTAGRWATAVYPFAVSGVDDIAVLDSYNKATGALGFKSTTASVANEPFLMRSTEGATEITLSNVDVAAAAVTDAVKNEASLKGAYTETTVGAGEGVYNYVLSSNTIYKIGENSATIPAYRAYIQIAQPASGGGESDNPARALTFFIDNTEVTTIEGISAAENENSAVYNLQGQRIGNAQSRMHNSQLKPGLYIVNGKKVVVK